MDEKTIQEIVMRVVALLSLNGPGAANGHTRTGRRVLCIFSGASAGQHEGLETVRQLKAEGHHLTVVLTGAGCYLLGERLQETGVQNVIGPETWANAPGLVKEHEVFLVPTLSMNFAARLAQGMMDTLPSTLVVGALLAGKPVIAIRDGADPDGSGGQVFGASLAAPALRARLSGNLKTLTSYGIELVGQQEFFGAVQRHLSDGGRAPARAEVRPVQAVQILTQADLVDLPPGSVLRLPSGTRLTPLAIEAAGRLAIQLIYE